ncbi:hypothetical protein DM02DRAFT_665318 [Periconia macrospinosa]|uniref:Uncharacterized protein n=1 Tax=Periconia macrospinosa TaxID=97972 RepID=A0A2V1CWZ0_9PLEO|nr:hypothetical protein DM02DRAFT_665318 [Periconia macrospinosa]
MHLLIIPIVICYAIATLGCFPRLENVYLVALAMPATNGTTESPEIRIGYFGLYSGNASDLVCLCSAAKTPTTLAARLRQSSATFPPTADVESLIRFATTIQSRIFPPLLATSGLIFTLSLLALALLKRNLRKSLTIEKSSPARQPLASTTPVTQAAPGMQFVVDEMARLTSSQKQQNMRAGAELAGWRIRAGNTQPSLQWSIVACLVVFSISIGLMHPQASSGGRAGGPAPPRAGGPAPTPPPAGGPTPAPPPAGGRALAPGARPAAAPGGGV